MKIPRAYPLSEQTRGAREVPDDKRGLSELALTRERGHDGIAMSWDAYNAKRAATQVSNHNPKFGSNFKSATASPDGNKVLVNTANGESHEFTKTPNGWQHNTGQPAHAGAAKAIDNMLSTGAVQHTAPTDINLPKD